MKRAEGFEWARLRLLDSKIVDGRLSRSEVDAVTAHLRMNFSETVRLLTDTQLQRFVSNTPVRQLETATQEIGQDLPEDLLYEKGKQSDICTLILSGKCTILVGSENFRSDLTSWSMIGKTALETASFVPDFSAFVSDGPCRCLQFRHSDFVEAVDASTIERRVTESRESKGLPQKGSVEEEFSKGSTRNLSPNLKGESIPNRREKLIACLLETESNPNEEAKEPGNDGKHSHVVFQNSSGIIQSAVPEHKPKGEMKKNPDSIL